MAQTLLRYIEDRLNLIKVKPPRKQLRLEKIYVSTSVYGKLTGELKN